MPNIVHTIVRAVLVGTIVLALALLLWWYFFLRAENTLERALSDARGLAVKTPEFSAPEGSTYLNLLRSIPSTPLWRAAEEAVKQAGERTSLGKQEVDAKAGPRVTLWQASKLPTAGMTFVMRDKPVLRFVERATGNVLEADPSTKTTSRLTNTLVPKTFEALFIENRVFIRGSENDVVTTKTGVVTAPTSAQTFVSYDLENNILSLAISPSGQEIAYSTPELGGGAALMIAKENGGKKKRVVTLGTRGWLVNYFANNRILITERSADDVPGNAYEVTSKGLLTPVLRNIPGLVVSPHASSTALIYSTSKDGTLALFVRQENSPTATALPLKTTADKCVFAPDGATAYCAAPEEDTGLQFLNRWYRGEIHTTDSWWEIDVARGVVRRIFEPELEAGVSIDVEIPVVSDDGAYVAFRNARDWSLWVLSVR